MFVESLVTAGVVANLVKIGLSVYTTNAKVGEAPRALWGLATLNVQFQSGPLTL